MATSASTFIRLCVVAISGDMSSSYGLYFLIMKMLYLKKINGINTLISTFYYSKKIAVAICHICIYIYTCYAASHYYNYFNIIEIITVIIKQSHFS